MNGDKLVIKYIYRVIRGNYEKVVWKSIICENGSFL